VLLEIVLMYLISFDKSTCLTLKIDGHVLWLKKDQEASSAPVFIAIPKAGNCNAVVLNYQRILVDDLHSLESTTLWKLLQEQIYSSCRGLQYGREFCQPPKVRDICAFSSFSLVRVNFWQ